MARECPFTCLQAWPRFRRSSSYSLLAAPFRKKLSTVQAHLAADALAAGDRFYVTDDAARLRAISRSTPAGDHLVIGEHNFLANQFRRVNGFEAFDSVGFTVANLGGDVFEDE